MVLIRLRKVALTVAARCSGVAPSIGVFYQDGRPNGGRSVTRTGRGDSYMDDPRSELESMLSSSIDAELPFALERKYVPHHV